MPLKTIPTPPQVKQWEAEAIAPASPPEYDRNAFYKAGDRVTRHGRAYTRKAGPKAVRNADPACHAALLEIWEPCGNGTLVKQANRLLDTAEVWESSPCVPTSTTTPDNTPDKTTRPRPQKPPKTTRKRRYEYADELVQTRFTATGTPATLAERLRRALSALKSLRRAVPRPVPRPILDHSRTPVLWDAKLEQWEASKERASHCHLRHVKRLRRIICGRKPFRKIMRGRLRRAYLAWRYRRKCPLIPSIEFRRKRRYETFRRRLTALLWGRQPFRKASRPHNDRLYRYEYSTREFVPTGTPRTWRERQRRAGRAYGLISDLHAEGWEGLGFYFRYRYANLPEAEIDRRNRRADWVYRNGTRLRRIYAGVRPFQRPEGRDLTIYRLKCRVGLADSTGFHDV